MARGSSQLGTDHTPARGWCASKVVVDQTARSHHFVIPEDHLREFLEHLCCRHLELAGSEVLDPDNPRYKDAKFYGVVSWKIPRFENSAIW